MKTGEKCKCGADIIVSKGKYGGFLSCSNWQQCKEKYTKGVLTSHSCNACGNPLVLRAGKTGGVWYGCTNYPACKETYKTPPAKTAKSGHTPNTDQVNIINAFRTAVKNFGNGQQKIIIDADAGTGKTQTLAFLSWETAGLKTVYLAFMSRNIDDMLLRTDLAPGIKVTGFHRVSNSLLPKIKGNPADGHYDYLINSIFKDYPAGVTPTIDLMGVLKNQLMLPTDKNITTILESGLVDMPGDKACPNNLIIDSAKKLYYYAQQTGWDQYDFNDMLVDPIILGYKYPKYDVIFVDEMQDQNPARLAIIEQMAHDNSIIVMVGDPKQAIMGFTGSDYNLMQSLPRDVTMQLTITYRYTDTLLDHAKQYFPTLKTISLAPKGNNTFAGYANPDIFTELINNHQEGGVMVLCRNNAPLVPHCLTLLRAGIPAKILGRDIGRMLIGNILGYANGQGYNASMADVVVNMERQLNKLAENKARPEKIKTLKDKLETIAALAEGLATVRPVIDRINDLFVDDNVGIVFSTAHKSKGCEGATVIIIEPALFDFTGDDIGNQDNNLLYVALTRGKNFCYVLGEIGKKGG
jgi:hypothetical protein